jgi:hypothetical protein
MNQDQNAFAECSNTDLYQEWEDLSYRFGRGELNPEQANRKWALEKELSSRGVLRSR